MLLLKSAVRFDMGARLRYGDKLVFSLLGRLAIHFSGESILACPRSQEDLWGLLSLTSLTHFPYAVLSVSEGKSLWVI